MQACHTFRTYTSQRSLSPPGCMVQADTQFHPLAQQLLERHKPELCSQPPEARDIRMVCPSRGGESRCHARGTGHQAARQGRHPWLLGADFV